MHVHIDWLTDTYDGYYGPCIAQGAKVDLGGIDILNFPPDARPDSFKHYSSTTIFKMVLANLGHSLSERPVSS